MTRQTLDSISNLESLKLRARTLVESVLTGTHRGQQKGFSVDFSEHRDYSPGDDVRFIDWKLHGKRDRFYIRQFEDENQLQAWVLIDVSGSMKYRSINCSLSKLDYASTLAAAIVWIACYQRDQAGLLACDSRKFVQIGPVYGQGGAKKLIDEYDLHLSQSQSLLKRETDSEDQFTGLIKASKKIPSNSVVFVCTDAFGEPQELKKILSLLYHQNCDTRFLHVLDSAELHFPFTGNILFKGLEAGEYQTQSQAVREAYLKEFQEFLTTTKKIARDTNSDYVLVETDRPLDETLRQIMYSRKNS